MTVPTWLQQHLETCGLWDTDGVGRAARARRCRDCREYVLVGLSSDRCGFPVAVDPDPLSVRGEAVALLAERTTYSLRNSVGRLELDFRTHFEIRGEVTRSGLRHDVLARHVCGQPSLGLVDGLGLTSRLALIPSSQAFDGPPPF